MGEMVMQAAPLSPCQCCGSRDEVKALKSRHWIVISLCVKCRKKLAKQLVDGEEDL